MAAKSQIEASPNEINAFHDAMDSPSISHATSSQRTTGAVRIWSSNSCGLKPSTDPAEQLCGPSHQPRSTPV